MLTALAIIPSVFLLIYIYKKDKREKEPIKLLLKCFILGIIISIPVVILEYLIGDFVESTWAEGSFGYAVLDAFLVAGFSEELFKYLALKSATWKSKQFNCMFDGIVYAVFVSLGFATLENIFYVLDGGFSVAILRMFTSVPGHTCYAVFMGYFYSKAKKYFVDGDLKSCKKYKRLALLIPMLAHGAYDCFISFDEEQVGELVVLLAILAWLVWVVVQFVAAFLVINHVSKNDKYICPVVESGEYDTPFATRGESWVCSCRNINYYNFCTACGQKRTEES